MSYPKITKSLILNEMSCGDDEYYLPHILRTFRKNYGDEMNMSASLSNDALCDTHWECLGLHLFKDKDLEEFSKIREEAIERHTKQGETDRELVNNILPKLRGREKSDKLNSLSHIRYIEFKKTMSEAFIRIYKRGNTNDN